MEPKKILVIEDEKNIGELIEFNIRKNGFQSSRVDSAESALKLLGREHFDLILLDLMLTGMDGMDFCRIFRTSKEFKQIPIIMLTARSEDADIVSGLEYGANDYITKPFSPRVLIARIKARLRDTAIPSSDDSVVSYAGIVINSEFHEATSDGKPLSLTANEFILLRTFLKNPGKVFSRDAIITCVHGEGYPVTDRAVDVAVVGLRKKLGKKGALIETVRGVGYKFSRL